MLLTSQYWSAICTTEDIRSHSILLVTIVSPKVRDDDAALFLYRHVLCLKPVSLSSRFYCGKSLWGAGSIHRKHHEIKPVTGTVGDGCDKVVSAW